MSTVNDVRLNVDCFVIDYLNFRQALDCGNFVNATEIYKGRFLDNFVYVTDAFDDWRLETAASAHGQAVGAFNYLLSDALDKENYARAAALAKAALVLNPLDAGLIKTRVESLAVGGDIARALRELELARHHLRVELGAIPPELSDDLSQSLARLAKEPPSVGGGPIHVKLVGRNDELVRVRNHWRSAAQKICVVTIAGEPGIGKSRLLEHIVRRSVLDGNRVFMCRCSQAESKLPYGTIVNLICSNFRPADINRMTSSWASILATIAPEMFPAVAPAHGCSKRALWEAIAHFFSSAAETQPIVIAVDDLQWTDDVSADVLRYVSKKLSEQRSLLIAAFRGAVEAPVYEDDKPEVIAVQLGELDPASTHEFIVAAAAQCALDLPPAAVETLARQVRGSPFFLLEAIRQLVGTQSTTWKNVNLQLTDSLDRHLDERLRGIDSLGRRVLDAAAILGRPAALHFLSRVTGLSPVEIATTADMLVGRGLLTDTGDIRFSHDLLLEAQRRRIRPSDARLWHARIAEVLVARADSRSGEIAYHYENGGEQEDSCAFAYRARDEALAVHAHAEADAQFQRIIRCSPSGSKPHAAGEYVKWLAKCGRLKEIAPFSSSVANVFSERGDHEGNLAIALADFDQLERNGGSSSDLKGEALRIVEYAKQHAPTLLMAVLWQVADTLRGSGELALMSSLADIVQRNSASVPTNLATEMISVSALFIAISTGHAAALPIVEAAVQLAEATDDAIVLAKALYARGTINLFAGRISQASDDYARVARLADPVGPRDLIERMEANACVLLMEQGNLKEAELQALQGLREAPQARRGYAYGNLCMIALRGGDAEAASKYAQALIDWNSVQRHTWLPMNAQALLGLAELLTGNMESAAKRASFVRNSLQTGDAIMDTSHAYLLVARVDAAHGRFDDATQLLRQSARKIRGRDRLAGDRLDLERARLYARRGERRHSSRVASAIYRFAQMSGATSLREEAEALLT